MTEHEEKIKYYKCDECKKRINSIYCTCKCGKHLHNNPNCRVLLTVSSYHKKANIKGKIDIDGIKSKDIPLCYKCWNKLGLEE